MKQINDARKARDVKLVRATREWRTDSTRDTHERCTKDAHIHTT
jgi:hypothetical protein